MAFYIPKYSDTSGDSGGFGGSSSSGGSSRSSGGSRSFYVPSYSNYDKQSQAAQDNLDSMKQDQLQQQQQQQQAQQQAEQKVQQAQNTSNNFWDRLAGNIVQLSKPTSEGGINVFADAGNYAEKALHTGALIGGTAVAASTGANQIPAVQKQLNKQLQMSLVPTDVASGKATPIQFAGKTAQAGLEGAQYVAPFGKVGEAASIPIRLLTQGGVNAGVGAAQEALNEANNGQKLDVTKIGKQALIGGALGVGGTLLSGLKLKGAPEEPPSSTPPPTSLEDTLKPKTSSQPLSTGTAPKQSIELDRSIQDILKANRGDPEAARYQAASEVMRQTGKSLGESQNEVNRVIDQSNLNFSGRGPRDLGVPGGENMAPLTDKQARSVVLNARNASEGEKMNLSARHAVLDEALKNGYKGREEGMALLDSIEHPEDMNKNIAEHVAPERTVAFKNAVDEARKFADYVHDSQARVGAPVQYRENYLHHNVDYNEPTTMPNEVAGKAPVPKYAKERTFNDLREMYGGDVYGPSQTGYNLKYEDPRALFKDYAHQATKSVAGERLIDEINQNAPGHVALVKNENGLQPIDQNGRKFGTLRTPGLQSYMVSPQLLKQAEKYIEPQQLPGAVRGVDALNQTLKQSTLFGGGFHDFNVTKRYLFQELGSGITGEPKRLLNLVSNLSTQTKGFWSKGEFNHEMAKYRDSGLLDRVTTGEGRLTLGKSNDMGAIDKQAGVSAVDKAVSAGKTVAGAPKKANEFVHEFLFGRKIPLMKLQTAEAELKRANIPLKGDLTPQQALKLKDITKRINDQYGGINEGFIAKSNLGRLLQRQLMLAPDFTGGNINTVAGMFKGNAKGLAARQNITNTLGSIITYGALTGLIAASQGKDGYQAAVDKLNSFFDPKSGSFLSPNFDLPFTDSKGRTLEAKMPGSPIEEAAKLIEDPVHFAESRGSAAVGDVTKLISGKNYYGDPLVDPFQNPNPSFLDNLKAVGATNLPIPAQQGLNLKSGGQDAATTALNIAGFRVSHNPDDPQFKAQQDYYNTVDQLKSQLNPNDLAAFNSIHQTTKDRNGNYVVTPSDWDSQAKATLYLQHPNVFAADLALNKKLAASGQQVDPFWTALTPERQQQVLMYRSIPPFDAAGHVQVLKQIGSWYKPFQQLRNTYLNSLPTDQSRPQAPDAFFHTVNGKSKSVKLNQIFKK